MPKIKVNDIEIYYESYGQGTPLVLITGFNGDHLLWQNVIETYAKNYQVIVFDNRGSGQTSAPDMLYSIEMMAQDVAGLCEALSIQKAYFIGISMGGAILQTLAKNKPDLVKAAVFNNTFFKIQQRFAYYAKACRELLLSQTCTPELKDFLTKVGMTWGFSNEFIGNEEIMRVGVEMSLANPHPITPIGYKNQLTALLNFDSSKWLKDLNLPCLVIGANDDSIVTVDHFREFAEKISNAEYYEFDKVGHLPHIEKPVEYNEKVMTFFRKHPM